MKPSFILLSLMLLSHGLCAQWVVKHVDLDARIWSEIRFWDDSMGVVVGDGYMVKTEDQGESWTEIANAPNAGARALQLLSDSIILWAGNSPIANGWLARSRDGGATWDSVTCPLREIEGIHFWNDSSGFVTGLQGLLWTHNFGQSWDSIFWHDGLPLSFWSYRDIDFVGADTAYLLLDILQYLPDYEEKSQVLRSDDGGFSWQVVHELPVSTHSMDFWDSQHGYVGGFRQVYYTSDGGQSFALVQDDIGATPAFFVPNHAIVEVQALGPAQAVFAGYTPIQAIADPWRYCWLKAQDTAQWIIMEGVGVPLTSTWFLNDSVGFVAGWYGLIMKTTTSGGPIEGNYPQLNVSIDDRPQALGLQMRPNPARSRTVLAIPSGLSLPAMVHVFNAMGQRVYQQPVAPGQESLWLNLEGVSPGVYMVSLSSARGQATGKLLVY